MATLSQFGPGTITRTADAFQAHEKSRIRAAARHARRAYPGEVGELLYRELTAYAEFGIRFSVDALIPRLATRILAAPVADDPDVTSITDRRSASAPQQAAAS